MAEHHLRRYELVSRRAMLKVSLGTGASVLFTGLACSSNDEAIFAGATAEQAAAPGAESGDTGGSSTESSTESLTESESDEALQVDGTTTTEAAQESSETQTADGLAVNGEMVVSFTYTQGAEGLDERPYIAVWIEDSAGELVETVALWYEQGRRGSRWLDHLTRWFEVDAQLVAAGGASNAATVTSATRDAGSYAVMWDGTANTAPVAAGDYYVCIEAAREEGPHSLIREPMTLTGSLTETALPDEGELSLVTVRIDV